MARLTPPPVSNTEWKTLPDDVYEYVVVDVKEVPNKYFNPAKPEEGTPTQLEWQFALREEAEKELPETDEGVRWSTKLKSWMSPNLTRHPRNKLAAISLVINENFDIDVAYGGATEQEAYVNFRKFAIGAPLRIIIKTPPGKSFPKVEGFMPSRLGPPSYDEMVRLGVNLSLDEGEGPF